MTLAARTGAVLLFVEDRPSDAAERIARRAGSCAIRRRPGTAC